MAGTARLAGKRALVTGAGSGIGQAIALAFAREGARVQSSDIDPETASETARIVVCDLASRRDDGLAPVADAISDRGGEAIAMAVDVSVKADIEAAVATTLGAWGGVDILVNNAGTTAGAGPFLGITDADWQLSFVVNLKAPTDLPHCANPCSRELRECRSGCRSSVAPTATTDCSARLAG